MKFREHRGGLKESMATTIEVRDTRQLLEYLAKKFPEPPIEEVKISPVGFDEKIGWESSYVSVRYIGKEDFVVIGILGV